MIPTDDLVSHMRGVQAAERDLRDLAVVWQMIESSAAISCPDEVAPILPTLVNTRERFDDLHKRLVAQMVTENEAELGDELGAKAQCAIDILVRNLYERTADVGFLATDDVVRAYCAGFTATAEPGADERRQMLARLAEYQAKYTVYDDIVLLSPQGRILARLDGEAALAASADPIVAEALAAPAYVERFRATDLGANPTTNAAPALLYAHRITASTGQPVGVLVLRFRFADEMRRIFDGIGDHNHQMALVLVDEQQHVVATNDEAHVPTGALLARVEGSAVALSSFAGREYLAVCRASAGYQGYRGPAWRAQAMVSLLTAFRQRAADDAEGADGDSVPLDNAALVALNHDADAINRDLRRVVWNGRLMAGEQAGEQGGERARLKAVLKQVNQAGLRTRERVGRAIQDIYRTSLARARRQTRELARLAADIMDRNLYERANDCRWWALSPVLRRGLAQPADAAADGELARVLDHINGLYTVYSRLVAFDTEGVIRAASRRGEGAGFGGQRVPAHWLQSVGCLGHSQAYAVSPFEATDFHDQGPTYVYLAAVRGEQAGAGIVGGIAIVFNAASELAAMLRDIMAGRSGVAAFVDANGQVLAATDAALAARLAGACKGGQALVDDGGTNYACARIAAGGYREFKSSDGYSNGVHALVGLRLGNTERRRAQMADRDLAAAPRQTRAPALEVAVFQVGGSRYALPTADVMQAVGQEGLVRTPGATGAMLGMVEVQCGPAAQLVPVLCARRLFNLNSPSRASDGVLLVLRSPRQPALPALALRVDDVLSVIEVARERVHNAPAGFGTFAPWVTGLIDCHAVAGNDSEAVLVQLLGPQHLAAAALPLAPQAGAVATLPEEFALNI